MLYVLLVWLHILAAASWVGGAIFMVFVLVPVMRTPELRASAGNLVHAIGARFRWLGWICLGTLVASGSAILAAKGIGTSALCSGAFWSSPFGHTLAFKLLLVASILSISGVHDFVIGPRARKALQANPTSAESAGLRRQASWMGRLVVLLALAVILLGVSLSRGILF